MAMAEKALARAAGRQHVAAGEFVTASIDLVMTHDIFAADVFGLLAEAGISRVWDPERVVVVFDHLVPAPTIAAAEAQRRAREHIAHFGVRHFYGERAGICHQVLAEKGHALPGRLLVATDSHTTTVGALGTAGTGIGTSEMAYVLATGRLWFKVPETIRVELAGQLPAWATTKDLVLFLAGRYGADVARYCALEYGGPGAASLSVDSRLTVCNMGVELGAKFAFFEADQVTLAYLASRTSEPLEPFGPDPGARYRTTYHLDLSSLEPQVALPHNIDNVRPVSEALGLRIDQAFVGSCTNGRLEDLEAAATILRGRQVHPSVRMIVVPASQEVYAEAARRGLLEVFSQAGAVVLSPGCGPCFGGHQGLLAPGERCIGTHNRNFRGRMGSPQAEIYLASPATVAASAVAGAIADPREL
ncbi:MAG: 3-isopropylmalate dehydratase large subunit [Chloroflexi bacterium]|nr:3-isopropylmalate dehydratase large subunit [Chloroflexota bacterium]